MTFRYSTCGSSRKNLHISKTISGHRQLCFVENRKVAIVNPESGAAYEVASGQYLLGIPLKQVIDDTKADILAFRSRSRATSAT